jgi:dephospho-CoA kinase
MIIGITGTLGAGKGTVVEYLKEKGLKHYSAREFIVKEVTKRGLEPIRDNITAVADDLRKKNFPGYIISELLKEAEAHGGNAVIESVRALGEIEVLRKSKEQFYLFAVDAYPRTRYERVIARKASTDNVTFEKFIEDEQKESTGESPWRGNLPGCIKLADFVFQNNGTKEELFVQVENVLKEIKI